MRSAAIAILLVSIFALTPLADALACEAEYDVRLVGFSTDGSRVILRESRQHGGEQDSIDIRIYDLKTGQRVEEHGVCGDSEECRPGPKTPRGKNWRRISEHLEKAGYRIDPDYPSSKGIASLGIAFALEEGEKREDLAFAPRKLVALRGKKRKVVFQEAAPGSVTVMETGRCAGPFVDPKGRYVFVISMLCGFQGLQVATVAEIDRALGRSR
ncbi:MAG: hypothetical protein JXR96_18080 [Deltaproteobacteria bacterium]|nr:hypothetical protein [Deltaproteobacteria bacterium]